MADATKPEKVVPVPEAAKASKKLVNLAGLEIERRRLIAKLIAVHVETGELLREIHLDPVPEESRGLRSGVPKTRFRRIGNEHNKLNNIEPGVSPLDR